MNNRERHLVFLSTVSINRALPPSATVTAVTINSPNSASIVVCMWAYSSILLTASLEAYPLEEVLFVIVITTGEVFSSYPTDVLMRTKTYEYFGFFLKEIIITIRISVCRYAPVTVSGSVRFPKCVRNSDPPPRVISWLLNTLAASIKMAAYWYLSVLVRFLRVFSLVTHVIGIITFCHCLPNCRRKNRPSFMHMMDTQPAAPSAPGYGHDSAKLSLIVSSLFQLSMPAIKWPPRCHVRSSGTPTASTVALPYAFTTTHVYVCFWHRITVHISYFMIVNSIGIVIVIAGSGVDMGVASYILSSAGS